MNYAQPFLADDGKPHMDYSFQNFARLNDIPDTEHIGTWRAYWLQWMQESYQAARAELLAAEPDETYLGDVK